MRKRKRGRTWLDSLRQKCQRFFEYFWMNTLIAGAVAYVIIWLCIQMPGARADRIEGDANDPPLASWAYVYPLGLCLLLSALGGCIFRGRHDSIDRGIWGAVYFLLAGFALFLGTLMWLLG